MQQRRVGSTGLTVSRLGLGTMTWGRDTDEHEARDQLTAFVEAGGTLVDTAAGYGNGASEELLGTLIGDVAAREDLVLATKAGITARRGGREYNTSRGHLLATLDASLRRLGVDHVDLWQVHIWSDETPVEETLAALDAAVQSGRASYVGVSNYSGFLPWSPLGRGVLTGKYRTGTPSDSRAASSHFANFVNPYLDERSAGIVEAVARAADGLGWTALEVALTWVRDRPGVTAPVVGARTAAQLRGALGVEELSLPAEITAALDDVSAD
jgi:aryl-alcohol dehydrogenase-like predicted oxidoreductase